VDVDWKTVSGMMFFSGVCEYVNWVQLVQVQRRANRNVDISFEKLGTTDPTSRHHISKESNLQLYRCENFKFSKLRCFLKGGEIFNILCGI
jgi:hypothetical protein